MKKQPKTIRKRMKHPTPPKDLTGKRFGKWVVQEYARKRFVHRTWLCRCDCGVQKYVDEYCLIKARSKQCRRCSWDSYRIHFPKDLTGKRFGKWVVLKYAGKKVAHKIWLCRCDCDVQKHVHESNLVGKLSTQCRQCSWKQQTKVRTKSYLIWYRLKQSGLLCKKWQDYDVFKKAVGDPPSENAPLLRFNKFEPHAPGNTYWVDSISEKEIQRETHSRQSQSDEDTQGKNQRRNGSLHDCCQRGRLRI